MEDAQDGSRLRRVGALSLSASGGGQGAVVVSGSLADALSPPGYNAEWDSGASQSGRTVQRRKEVDAQWKLARAWEIAQAPVKNFLMMGFMMWMAGSTVHIFSIGIVFSILWQPVAALRSVDTMFKPFEDPRTSILGPKLLFIALQVAALGAGLWKLNTLGLLPTKISDWISQLPPRQVIEISTGGIVG